MKNKGTFKTLPSIDLSKYQCLTCQTSALKAHTTFWKCDYCGQQYPCVKGIPKLYLESSLGERDKVLRDNFYNGFLGTYYQHVMPFLSLPVRPLKISWKAWLAYLVVLSLMFLVTGNLLAELHLASRTRTLNLPTAIAVLLFLSMSYLFYKHRYLLYLFILAIPVRTSLLFSNFRPDISFVDVHSLIIEQFFERRERLQILDISTGTCNSLYRHGWMKLDADYTGLDLSETMLLQGRDLMISKGVPMEFVLSDATKLPFRPETFDIVLNYGAINGLTDPAVALKEMARVSKSGGLVLFLDEQLYSTASFIERLYFRKVLSSHNSIHRCPVELVPNCLENVNVHQVYHFYYLCTAFKK